MNESFNIIRKLVEKSPEIATLIIIILLFGKEPIKKLLNINRKEKNGKEKDKKPIIVTLDNVDGYVKRPECHGHIDKLRNEIRDRMNDFKVDLKDRFDLMIEVIKGNMRKGD